MCTRQDRGSSMMAYRWDQYCVHDRNVAGQLWLTGGTSTVHMTGPWQLNDGLQVGPVLCTWQDRGSSMMAYRWDQYCVHDRTVAGQ